MNVSQSGVQACLPSLALDTGGNPNIAWSEGSDDPTDPNPAEIFYKKWNGSAWTDPTGSGTLLSQVSHTPYPSSWAHLALDSHNHPYIVWTDGPDINREIFLLKWNGIGWVDSSGSASQSLINISNSPDYSGWSSITIDKFDFPHVAWEDYSSGFQDIYYLKYNGSGWVDVTGSGQGKINVTAGYHTSSVPVIRLDRDGTPYILHNFGSIETPEVLCVKWNGTVWTDVTGSGTSFANVTQNDINDCWADFDIDASGSPYIVCSSGVLTEQHDIDLYKWMPEGTTTCTPTISATETIDTVSSRTPSFTITRTITLTKTPTITITLTSTMTHNPNPTATPNICWADVDGHGQESKKVAPGAKPVLKLDSAGNPNLVWQDNSDIYYLRWNGISWVGASGSSGYAGSLVSLYTDNNAAPDLCLDNNGYACVAWCGGIYYGQENVFFLRWNGTRWVDMDGNGVESIAVPLFNGYYPQDVSLKLNASQNPAIAWSDYPENLTYTSKNIFYAYYNGSDWVDSAGSGHLHSMITVNNYESIEPSLVISGGNLPEIAWIEKFPAGYSVVFKKWNGTNWVAANGIAGAETKIVLNTFVTDARHVKLALDLSGNPQVVFDAMVNGKRRICYLRWNGYDWVDFDGTGQDNIVVSNTPGDASGPSIAIDGGGNPHIAWFDTSGVYYIRFNGVSFTGADGMTGNGLIAAAGGQGKAVSVALGNGYNPNIAWYDDIDGQNDVYFLKYICIYATPSPTLTVSPTITVTASGTMTPFISTTPTVTVSPTVTPAAITLKIRKRAFGSNPNPGTEILYEITIDNEDNGPAFDPAIWDTLPAEISFVRPESAPVPVVNGKFIYWDLSGNTLAHGGQYSVRFTARIDSVRPDGLIINRASTDYNDPAYTVNRHPQVQSGISFYPEGRAVVYPNPFNPATANGGQLKFANIVPRSRILIYTLSGEQVASITARDTVALWNGRNRNNGAVSSGIYYYTAENMNSGEKEKGKIFVVSR
jgi:hypothetical protein